MGEFRKTWKTGCKAAGLAVTVSKANPESVEWGVWYNGSHRLEPLGYVPPAEFEKAYHDFWDSDWGTS